METTRWYHYRISNSKIWFGYACPEPPRLDNIRVLATNFIEAIAVIENFKGDGWLITTFLIETEGEDGLITDPIFKKYAA